MPSLTFQATEFSTPAGITQINYNDLGGTHTLLFTDPKFSGSSWQFRRGRPAR